MTGRLFGIAPLVVSALFVVLHAGCQDPKVPEASCKVVPPQTSDAKSTSEQAAKLNAKVVNMPVEGGAEAENRAEAQITETYQTVSDKQAACAMLFQTIQCLEHESKDSRVAAKLAENVVALCSNPPPPIQATATPSAEPTPSAPPPPPASSSAVAPVSSPSPGVTQCSLQSCGLASNQGCSITCQAPSQAMCTCDSGGGALGLPTQMRANCRCERPL